MFTGIIEEYSATKVLERSDEGLHLSISRPSSWDDLRLGESINTDGVCLTIAELQADSFSCFLIPETLSRSSFGKDVPAQVNLERAMKMGDRLDGHIVQGHIDTVSNIQSLHSDGGDVRLTMNLDPKDRKYVVQKGSITINGISLTVASVQKDSFEVAIIPYTLAHTTMQFLREGDWVNVEYDVLGKYVLNALPSSGNSQT